MNGFLLVDGENIDRTLGQILERKPAKEQRPNWGNVLLSVQDRWEGISTQGLFFINVTRRAPHGFIAYLKQVGYTPVLLLQEDSENPEKVVDDAIIKTMVALRSHYATQRYELGLVSCDRDFYAEIEAHAQGNPGETLVVGFEEYTSQSYYHAENVTLLDLAKREDGIEAFSFPLPRALPITVAEYDPMSYLML